MRRRNERTFEFDRPDLLEYCGRLASVTRAADKVDIVRVRKALIQAVDRWIVAEPSAWKGFAAAELARRSRALQAKRTTGTERGRPRHGLRILDGGRA